MIGDSTSQTSQDDVEDTWFRRFDPLLGPHQWEEIKLQNRQVFLYTWMAGIGDKTAEVVWFDPYYRQRWVLEAWHIRTEHHPGLGRSKRLNPVTSTSSCDFWLMGSSIITMQQTGHAEAPDR